MWNTVYKTQFTFRTGQGEVRATGLWTSTRENVLEHNSGQRLYETWRSGTDTGIMGAGNLKTESIYERVAYPRKGHTSQTYYYNMESVQCLKCSRTYPSTKSLQRYQRERHGPGLEFHCRRCSNTYSKRWNLSSHYRENHPEHVSEAEAILGPITKEVVHRYRRKSEKSSQRGGTEEQRGEEAGSLILQRTQISQINHK